MVVVFWLSGQSNTCWKKLIFLKEGQSQEGKEFFKIEIPPKKR